MVGNSAKEQCILGSGHRMRIYVQVIWPRVQASLWVCKSVRNLVFL